MSHFTEDPCSRCGNFAGGVCLQVIQETMPIRRLDSLRANAQSRQKAQSRARRRRPRAAATRDFDERRRTGRGANLSALTNDRCGISDLPLEDALLHLQEHHHITSGWTGRR